MTLLDYFVIFTLVLSIASSAANGLIRCSLTLISAIAGLILAGRLYSYPAKAFGILTNNPHMSNFGGFAFIFVIVVVGGTILSHSLRHRLEHAKLTWLDKMLGAGFGFVRGWLIAATIYLGLIAFPIKFDTVQNSVFAPYLAYSTQAITYAASDKLRSSFNDTYSKLEPRWNKKERSSRQ